MIKVTKYATLILLSTVTTVEIVANSDDILTAIYGLRITIFLYNDPTLKC